MLTKIKSGASSVGRGVLNVTTAMHNGTIQNQLTELDEQAAALRAQLKTIEDAKTKLKSQLI